VTGHDHDGQDRAREHRGDGHDHAAHGHAGHGHAPADFGWAFALGTALNLGFVALEATYGFMANSTALLADAGHNLSDVFGLLMAWGAAAAAKRLPSERYTYGWRSSSILAALANAILLLVAVGAIAWEALPRFGAPEPVAGGTVMAVAAVGIVINAATAMLFMRRSQEDINVRGAYLHMLSDAAVSAGVVVAGLMILVTGAAWLDPLVSLAISALIVWGTWSLLGESVDLALHAVPRGIDPAAVRAHLAGLPGVATLHDLHIWPMSTTETALTCHLVIPSGHPGDAFLADTAHILADRFGINHVTLQIETDADAACALAPDHVV
jgi:cobalt-zinc-cadmium efflux system protein